MTTIKIIRPWSFALLFVVLSSAPLHISAKSCSIRIKDRSTLSADANAIFNSIMSQPEIIWGNENTCRDTTCQRIPYWSNPEITYTGIAIGSTLENNARVWNERASTVSAFRARDAIISLDSIDNNTDALFESYSATSVITTGNGYEVQSGQIVDMAATSQIKLTPGTHIKRGANYRAAIRSNADDSNYPQFIKRKDIPNNKEINNKRFAIFPNPVNAILQIQTSEELAQVNIYNLNGQCVMRAAQTDIDVSALPQGMYILRAVTIDSIPLQAKFIKQ